MRAGNKSGVEVAVAATDIQVNAKLGDREVRLVRIPKSVAPPDALHSTSEIIGRRVILPILKGEFILPSKLAAETGFGSVIPARMCAVSVRVDEIISVAGFVVPGSRVDVLLTRNSPMTNEPLITTVLKDVAVIAVGSMIERNAAGEPRSTPVMTLLVLPEDEQKLTLASSQGHIQLALRTGENDDSHRRE